MFSQHDQLLYKSCCMSKVHSMGKVLRYGWSVQQSLGMLPQPNLCSNSHVHWCCFSQPDQMLMICLKLLSIYEQG